MPLDMSSQEISWPVTWQRLIWIFLVSLLKQINCLHSLSVSGFIDWKSGSRKTTDPLEMQLISSEWTLRQVPEIALWLRRVDRRWRRHFHFYAPVGRWEINCLFLRADNVSSTVSSCTLSGFHSKLRNESIKVVNRFFHKLNEKK